MSSRARFWPSAYMVPFSQPAESSLRNKTHRDQMMYEPERPNVQQQQQLSADSLPSMKLYGHFGLLLGLELVIVEQAKGSTFCC